MHALAFWFSRIIHEPQNRYSRWSVATRCGSRSSPIVLIGTAILWWPRRRIVTIGSAMTGTLLLVVACDAFLVEPTWLEVSHFKIASEAIDKPVRIAVLADLHVPRIGPYERKVFRRAMQENPDVILLAGDYVSVENNDRGEYRTICQQLNAFLREIEFSAPNGVYAVRGNADGSRWSRIFDGLKVTPVESTKSFRLDGFRLTCLSLNDSYLPSLKIDMPERDQFHVIMGHVPNFCLGQIEADLLLAGHTHGGQVRLPLIGPLTTHSLIPSNWAAGMTALPGGGQLLVSRGTGLAGGRATRVRFLCRPELVVVDLVPE